MPRPGKRRLFFALWPEDELRTRIVRATRAEVRGTGGKPTPPENLHMTLHFLGPTPDELIAPLIERAFALPAEPLRFDPGPIRATGSAQEPCGWASVKHRPRSPNWPATWAASRTNWGCRASAAPFTPHMTLARKVNRLTPRDPPPPMHWPVNEFALVDSLLGGRHSRYTTLANFP